MSKSLEAVFSPHKFIPPIISDDMDFEYLWNTKQPFVLSNIAHVAYFNEIKIKTFMSQLGAEKIIFYDIKGAQAFCRYGKTKLFYPFAEHSRLKIKANIITS